MDTELPMTMEETTSRSDLMTPPEQAFQRTRDRIRESLIEADDEGNGVGRRRADIWDDVVGAMDLNEGIKLNIQQVQMHIQDSEQHFWRVQSQHDSRLQELADKGPEHFDQYTKEKREYDEGDAVERRHIQELYKTHVKLAAEYRQCAMQKKLFIHIVQVKQLELVVQAAIHRHIPDRNLRNTIAEEIEEGVRNLFPVGNGMD